MATIQLEENRVGNLLTYLARTIEKPDAPRFKTAIIMSEVLDMIQDIEKQTGVKLDTDLPGEVSTIPKRESKIETCNHTWSIRDLCALCGLARRDLL